MTRFALTILAITLCSSTFAAQDNQLNYLPPSKTPRFNLEQYNKWPTNFGQASVALWADNKTAAVTITIDDNFENDHPFWTEMNEKYGLTFTWFVMVDNVKNWNNFKKLLAQGHDIQAHDTCHVNKMDDPQYQSRLEHARDQLNKNLATIPDYTCQTYAYPCGKARVDTAANVFIAARGVIGVMNNANTLDYMHINSGGANANKRIDILLDPSLKLWNKSYHRGWLSVHYHGLAKQDKGISKSQSKTAAYLKYVAKHKDDLWIAGFTQVAKYGQERDTHKLTTVKTTKDTIALNLTDKMNDQIFNYPLTVKVCLEKSWQAATVEQGGNKSDATIIEHQGKKYAIIKAIPDAGQINIIKK